MSGKNEIKLLQCAAKGDSAGVKSCIKKGGVDINCTDEQQRTPLHLLVKVCTRVIMPCHTHPPHFESSHHTHQPNPTLHPTLLVIVLGIGSWCLLANVFCRVERKRSSHSFLNSKPMYEHKTVTRTLHCIMRLSMASMSFAMSCAANSHLVLDHDTHAHTRTLSRSLALSRSLTLS
jgi:hypothetical protein